LKRSGKAENTYVVFTADHGLGVGEHGLFGKQNLFDHSVRVPFMVKGPGIPAGVKNNSPIYLQDIMPTTLQWAGLEKPDHVQFQSLLPLIHADQRQAKTDRTIYGGYLDVQRSVTHGRYKLVLYPKIKKTLLFDLKADPLEMNDVSDDPKNQGIVRKLFAELLRLQKETGDTLDLLADFSTLEN
jgi:choline-sulfatase